MSRRCGERNKILGLFSRDWKIWFHYVLLTLVLMGIFYLFPGSRLAIYGTHDIFAGFLSYTGVIFLTLSISDQIIHKILGVD